MHRKWWTLIAVCTAVFMLLLDITVVQVALPSIEHQMHASLADLQWVIDAYALTLAALLLAAGAFADRLGRRKVFAVGLVTFTLASLGCAMAGSPWQLIAARGIQGIGGAIMFSTSLALLAHAFRGPERGVAFAAWGAITGIAVAVGPLIGGALTETLGWQYIFWLNLPIGIAATWVTLSKVEESRDERIRKMDWGGLVTFCAALFALVYGLIMGNEWGWTSGRLTGVMAGAVALLVTFVVIELGSTAPLFDLSLFRSRTFVGVSIVAFSLSAGMFAMFLYLTLYMQNVLGYSPFETGVRFMPISGLGFVFSIFSGRLSERVPARLFMGIGLASVGIGLWFMAGLNEHSHWSSMVLGMLLCGTGIGLVNPPMASTAVSVVEPARAGIASGMNSTFRQVGIATGIAGLGAVFQHTMTHRVMDRLAHTPLRGNASEIGHLLSVGNAEAAFSIVPPQSRGLLRSVMTPSFASGMNSVLMLGAAVAIAGSIAAFALVKTPPRTRS